MAKKKLNEATEVTSLSDNESVMIRMEGGGIGWIKKNDLANALTDVMRTVTKDQKGLTNYSELLVYKDHIEDCNITETGIYACLSHVINMPASIRSRAILIVFRCYTSNAYVFQLWFDLLGRDLYWRKKTDQTWSSWKLFS